MPQFTPSQLAQLRNKFLENLAGAVPGATLEPGSVPGSALIAGDIPFTATVPGDFATGAQGNKADLAHGWGDHATAGYATNQAYIDTQAGVATTSTLTAEPTGAIFVVVSGVSPVRVDAATAVGVTLTFATPLVAGELAHIIYIGS